MFAIFQVADSQRKNLISDSFENLQRKFRLLVSRIALDLEEHGLLTNLHELTERDQTRLKEILDGECKAKIGEEALLFWLTKVLKTLHKREVVVLVDEYDTPTS